MLFLHVLCRRVVVFLCVPAVRFLVFSFSPESFSLRPPRLCGENFVFSFSPSRFFSAFSVCSVVRFLVFSFSPEISSLRPPRLCGEVLFLLFAKGVFLCVLCGEKGFLAERILRSEIAGDQNRKGNEKPGGHDMLPVFYPLGCGPSA